MHDPMTVAFQIRNPILPRESWGHRPILVTIWHRDPQKHGGDDSCDWFGSHRKLNPREAALAEAIHDLQHVLGNAPFYPEQRLWGGGFDDDRSVMKRLGDARYQWARRRFWWHPRWHFHHWRIQVLPIQHFKRWAFSRCSDCGGRFRWGEWPVGNSWEGRGPGWFRREDVRHQECNAMRTAAS